MPLKPSGDRASKDSRLAFLALNAGDLVGARTAFRNAVRNAPSVAQHRYSLALVEAALGDATGAAVQLTRALSLKPDMAEAAQRLSDILSSGKIKHDRLHPDGLRAALSHTTIDRDVVAAASIFFLAEQSPLRDVLRRGEKDGWLEAARSLCLRQTALILQDKLFLSVLAAGVVTKPDMEFLLTGLRRVVWLEIGPERQSDPKLKAFLIALVQQMWCNEFVWSESDEEASALEQRPAPVEQLLLGEAAAEWPVLCHLLYRQPDIRLLAAHEHGGLGSIAHDQLRSILSTRLEADRDVRIRAERMEELAGAHSATSVIVARQYEAAPYPRWTGTPALSHSKFLAGLRHHFSVDRLAFVAKPFDVLIAGCGTGKQAVSAANDYGPNSRVLGMDIARRGLGYADMMAARMGVDNLRLAVGDITAIDQIEPSFEKRFQVIECAGVLHHMADPFSAWRALARCLTDDGIMLIGLYSKLARQHLTVLRQEARYPGVDADDAALRAYRSYLQTRLDTLPNGQVYKRSLDFYSASGFRDYFLHVSEQQMTLPEISSFLDECGLQFHGFVGLPMDALRTLHPGEPSPGSLARWAELEARNPTLFAGMYQFWVSKKASASPRG